MDFQTFVLAMSEIASLIYAKFVEDGQRDQNRTEAQALLALINNNLLPLDD